MRGSLVYGVSANAPALGIQSGGSRFASLRRGLTSQWVANETSAASPLLDSIGSLPLGASANVSAASGKVNGARQFAGTNWFASPATAPYVVNGLDFSFTTWFYRGTLTGTQQVFAQRKQLSADATIAYLLRTESAVLKMYIGDNGGTNFSVTTVASGLSTGTWYWFGCSFKNSTKELRYSFNGGAITSFTSTYAPSTAFGSLVVPYVNIGGDTAELASNGSMCDCTKFWSNVVKSDADLLLDYNGGVGVEFAS